AWRRSGRYGSTTGRHLASPPSRVPRGLKRHRLHLPQFRQALERFGLDLTDTLARQAEPAADFLERLRLGVGKPVAEDDHMALPVGERCQRLCERFAPQRAFHRLLGERIVVGDEVAENRVLLLADGL